jgi:hypothetical protein
MHDPQHGKLHSARDFFLPVGMPSARERFFPFSHKGFSAAADGWPDSCESIASISTTPVEVTTIKPIRS